MAVINDGRVVFALLFPRIAAVVDCLDIRGVNANSLVEVGDCPGFEER